MIKADLELLLLIYYLFDQKIDLAALVLEFVKYRLLLL